MKTKRLLWVCVCALSMGITGCNKEDDPVARHEKEEIPSETFPNEDFYTYLLEQFDTDKDGKLSVGEANAVTEIKYSAGPVTSLELFPNLQKLDCSVNTPDAQGPNQTLDVSQNAALKELYCANNQLNQLDVTHNPELEILDCSVNRNITVLDLSKNKKLKELHSPYLKLKTLNLSENTQLKKLNCSCATLENLNTSKNPELEELKCTGSLLKTLDLSQNTRLKKLDCSTCRSLENIHLSNNSALEELNINQCAALNTFDFSTTPQLKLLYCENAATSTIDIRNTRIEELNSNATYIYAKGCQTLKKITCTKATKWVDASESTIEEFNYPPNLPDAAHGDPATFLLNNCPNLKEFVCVLPIEDLPILNTRGFITLDVSHCASFEKLDANLLKAVTLTNCPSLKEVKCSGIMEKLDFAGNPNLEKIICNSQKLTDLHIKDCTNLKELQATGIYLNIDFSGNSKLERLTAQTESEVTPWDYSPLTSLKHIDIHTLRNKHPLDLRANKALEKITLVSMSSDISAPNLPALKEVHLSSTSESPVELNFSGCQKLETLKPIESGYIMAKTLNIEGCTSLLQLACRITHMPTFDVSHCTRLDSLALTVSQLTELKVNPTLRSLSLTGAGIQNFDPSDLSELTSLSLTYCNLRELNVSKNTKLSFLDCSNNRLTTLDLSKNSQLAHLNCDRNQLSELDASPCKALTSLYCQVNPNLKTLYLYRYHSIPTWQLRKDNQTEITFKD